MGLRFSRQLKSLVSAAKQVKTLIGRPRPTKSSPRKKPLSTRSSSSRPCLADDYLSRPYPGDFRGRARIQYSPIVDGKPDPGEIVWTWVPYEEDTCKGKDRPVLLVGWNDEYLLGAMLTTKDRNNASSSNPDYLDIGSGPWDSKGRPSEVKLDRIIQIYPDDVRRNGAVLPKELFEYVEDRLEERHGWTR